jgi:hypothetical protein
LLFLKVRQEPLSQTFLGSGRNPFELRPNSLRVLSQRRAFANPALPESWPALRHGLVSHASVTVVTVSSRVCILL